MEVPRPADDDLDVCFDMDSMTFFAAVIEQEIEVLDMLESGAIFVPELTESMTEISRHNIERAQTQLDLLIAADTTWRSA